ncbi:MAG: TIM barrel protein [Treponemataceae bacterium]
MKRDVLKAVRTIEEFDSKLFEELNIGVELQDFTEPALSDFEIYKTLNRYEKAFADFSKLKAMHGSFLDVDIASFNMDFAKYSKKLYTRDLFFAKILNLDFLIFHGNIKLKYENKTAWEFFMQLQKEFFAEAVEAAGFTGMVVLENVLDTSPKLILQLLETINLPQVKMNFDFGHAKISPTPIEIWIEEGREYIAYVHLHSNDETNDNHAPLTNKDALDITKILDKHNLQVPLCLEYWNCDLKKEIQRLEKIL